VGVLIALVALPFQASGSWIAAVLAMVIVGGLIVAAVTWLLPRWVAQVCIVAALLAGAGHLAYQTQWASTRYVASPRNPLAHAQTVTDAEKLVQKVQVLAQYHDMGTAMPVHVLAKNPWPLPWYFRGFDNIGFYPVPPEQLQGPAPVVISTMKYSKFVQPLVGEDYQVNFYGLRPDVRMLLFIEQPLWDRFIEAGGLSAAR
jgi:predicted membrane-bound mannosyltransferase